MAQNVSVIEKNML